MSTLEITLPDATAARLREAATRLQVAPEALVAISLEEKLARLDDDFHTAAAYVLTKNEELYRRLA